MVASRSASKMKTVCSLKILYAAKRLHYATAQKFAIYFCTFFIIPFGYFCMSPCLHLFGLKRLLSLPASYFTSVLVFRNPHYLQIKARKQKLFNTILSFVLLVTCFNVLLPSNLFFHIYVFYYLNCSEIYSTRDRREHKT